LQNAALYGIIIVPNNKEEINMKTLHFSDLTDTPFRFSCDFAGDAVDYWDYDFTANFKDERYCSALTRDEIEQLRKNCKYILDITEGI
jgi:hypothetical protein